MQLIAKFHHTMFKRSEVIVMTNKQTPLKTSTSLRYATPVSNNCYSQGLAEFINSFIKLLKQEGHHPLTGQRAPPISGGTYRRRRTLIDGYLESPFPTACLL